MNIAIHMSFLLHRLTSMPNVLHNALTQRHIVTTDPMGQRRQLQ